MEGTTFRGFLLRLSGENGENVEGSFTAVDDGTQLLPNTGEQTGLNSACEAGVAALSHANSDDRDSVTNLFQLNEEGRFASRSNCCREQLSTWIKSMVLLFLQLGSY